jgi:hypothetical protein
MVFAFILQAITSTSKNTQKKEKTEKIIKASYVKPFDPIVQQLLNEILNDKEDNYCDAERFLFSITNSLSEEEKEEKEEEEEKEEDKKHDFLDDKEWTYISNTPPDTEISSDDGNTSSENEGGCC